MLDVDATNDGEVTPRFEMDSSVLQELWSLYSREVLPLERLCHFQHFHKSPITLEEFEAKPQVLLLGQYSTGKTSMARWLTGVDSTHFDVRPQPSTDKFMAVVHGPSPRLIHGNAATCLAALPYQGLSNFGAKFLDSFQALALPSERLRDITFIDTPGVLSGSKQRIGRDYDFAEICAWMAERADLVLLTFDAHKLDISDEFQEVMEVIRPFADKVRCVLNKADQIDAANLVRVYGALLWNVGKIFRTPEVARVFVSSFWDEEYRFKDHKQLFDEDKQAVLDELASLPRTAVLRKINAFIARVRRVKAHFCVMCHIRSKSPWLPYYLGSVAKLRGWVDDNLENLFEEASAAYQLSKGDMPHAETFRASLNSFEELTRLPAFDRRALITLDRVVAVEVPCLMARVGGVSSVSVSCRELPRSASSSRTGLFGLFGGERPCKRQRT